MTDTASNDWNSGLVFAEISDVGMRRSNNQDSHVAVPAKSAERFSKFGHLFVVADGMGAHAAGELASRMATEHVAARYFRSTEGNQREALRDSVMTANNEIYRRGQSNPEFHNMGTTLSALVLGPTGALIGHVGDSRVYRLRGNRLEQLTFDHSLVWEMEASGKSGFNVPKNVITRSLGPNPNVEVDMEGPFPVEPGDKYLVCSDGLTGLVEDSELGPLMSCLPENQLPRVLVDLANLRGGPDNITLIVAHAKHVVSSSGRSGGVQTSGLNQGGWSMLALAAVCVLAAVGLGFSGAYVPMGFAVGLAVVSALIAMFQVLSSSVPIADEGNSPRNGHSRSPYRTYNASPNVELHQKLSSTVEELRDAATKNNWMMDWKQVDQLQSESTQQLKEKNLEAAIRTQAQAIVETMNQLREQNNRAASETSAD